MFKVLINKSFSLIKNQVLNTRKKVLVNILGHIISLAVNFVSTKKSES